MIRRRVAHQSRCWARGAWPGSMHPLYEIDYPAVEACVKDEPGGLGVHLAAAPEVSKANETADERR